MFTVVILPVVQKRFDQTPATLRSGFVVPSRVASPRVARDGNIRDFIVAVLRRNNKLPKNYRQKILSALQKLSAEPYYGKALKGEYKGFFSLRVWPYRVLYKIVKKQLIIEVVDIGHRQGIYK